MQCIKNTTSSASKDYQSLGIQASCKMCGIVIMHYGSKEVKKNLWSRSKEKKKANFVLGWLMKLEKQLGGLSNESHSDCL